MHGGRSASILFGLLPLSTGARLVLVSLALLSGAGPAAWLVSAANLLFFVF